MRPSLRSLALLVLLLAPVSRAAAADKLWSVSGILNGGLATVFSCTNGGLSPATVQVQFVARDGTPSGAITPPSVPALATVSLATQPVDVLGGATSDSLYVPFIALPVIRGGSAVITASPGVYCTAYVVAPSGDPPGVGWSLKVVRKTTQKGD